MTEAEQALEQLDDMGKRLDEIKTKLDQFKDRHDVRAKLRVKLSALNDDLTDMIQKL